MIVIVYRVKDKYKYIIFYHYNFSAFTNCLYRLFNELYCKIF